MLSRSDARVDAGVDDGRTILVVDREEITLWGFCFLLGRQGWVRRCLVAKHPAGAVAKLHDERVDLVLVDDRFGAPVVAALLAEIAVLAPRAHRVIIASGPSLGSTSVGAVRRTWTAARIVSAIRDIADIADDPRPAGRGGATELTVREREVLAWIARGETNREIGLRLNLSPHTIKQHTCSSYRKLGARNRTDAVQRARAVGLLI